MTTSHLRSQMIALYRHVFGDYTQSMAGSADHAVDGVPPRRRRQVKLPNEILIYIFMHLAMCDLVTCRRVSKAFQKLIDDDPEIQYRRELDLLQLRPTELARDLSLTVKLSRLRKTRMFRGRPRLMQVIELPVKDVLGVRFGRAFCHAYCTRSALLEEGVYDAVRCTSLEYIAPNGQPDATTFKHTFGVEFHSLCVDATQDLLVLLSWDKQCPVRILSLRHGTPSPLTDTPSGVLPLENYHLCKISGSALALLSEKRASYLGNVKVSLVDWRHGEIRAQLSKRCNVGERLISSDAFVLLSESVFLIAMQYAHSVAFEVYACGLQSTSNTVFGAVTHTATFEFPLWSPNGRLTSPSSNTVSSWMYSDGLNPYFTATPSAQIIVFDPAKLWATNPIGNDGTDNTKEALWFTFRAGVFLDSVQAYTNLRLSRARVWQWEHWGPDNTRCFPYDIHTEPSPLHPTVVSGARVLMCDRAGTPRLLYDFNMITLGKTLPLEMRKQEEADSTVSAVRRPSGHPPQGVFHQEIVTNLPYHAIRVKIPDAVVEVFESSTADGSELWVTASSGHQNAHYALLL